MTVKFKSFYWIGALIILLASVLSAQTSSSNILGTVLDPGKAAVPNAQVELREQATGAARNVTTDASSGLFRLNNIPAGTYTVTIKAAGFKGLVQKDIIVATSETRDLGQLELTLGNVSESISITAETTAIQLASSEKGGQIDSTQIDNIPQKGRDVFGLLSLMPGVLDTNTARDTAGLNPLAGLTINGNASLKNVTVDGLAVLDVGCGNCAVQGNPNMDAVQELKLLSSNYQAEFGRNSGGTITLVTKSGTQQFHGTGSWNHRHEEFNANTFFNNRSGIAIPKYRFNIATWSLGGPVYIPHKFNAEKKKFFIFASQEFTRQYPGATLIQRNMPTALERTGDFSQSFDTAGKLITIKDPSTGAPYPGNRVPLSQISTIGQNMLNFFPLPNYAPAANNPDYLKFNYQAVSGTPHPRRDDVLRGDAYLTPKLNVFFRVVKDTDITYMPFGTGDFAYAQVTHPWPGYTFGGSATYTASPTVVNELTIGKSGSTWDYFEDHPELIARTILGNVPKLYAITAATPSTTYSETNGQQAMYNFMPAYSYGGSPTSTTSFGIGSAVRHNPIAFTTYNDNLSKTAGKHNFKMGFYLEKDWKSQPGNAAYNGTYSFATSATNPLNTGNSYANGLIGAFTSYSEASALYTCYVTYTNLEWYLQDNWRVNRKLTLDIGVRFYHQSPQVDQNHVFAYFNPSLYSKANAPRQYVPGKNAAGTRVALDPVTGASLPAAAIGAYVPGTGNIANGMVQPGVNGVPLDTYQQPWLAASPRLGFAYDVFGDGKTAIRGGYGTFYNRLDGNQVYNMTGQAPVGSTSSVANSTISSLSSGSAYISPGNISFWAGSSPWGYVSNASLGVQQSLGWGTVIDASYSGDWAHNQPMRKNLNAIPLGANFLAANQDPTQAAGTPLIAALERVNYPGMGDLNQDIFIGYTNYNALQVSVNHHLRSGVQFGVSYTWAHTFGMTSFDPLVANNTARNYGPQATDRRQAASVNYSYQLPQLGKKLNSKALGLLTDNWNFSGVTTITSGAPFAPSYTLSTAKDITGSSSESPRIDVIGNPLANVPSGYFFNGAAFAVPAVGTIGNSGLNNVMGPGFTNFDMTLAKSIPLGEKRAFRVRIEGYNVFNHTEYSAVNSAAIFNAAGVQTNNQFGAYSATRPARVISFTARFEF